MKKILLGILLVSLLQANDSTISIQGNMNGDINKNGRDVINGNVTHNKNFNVELNLINNQRYNTSITKNITTIIKQDKKLLNEFKKQFGSIQANYIKLESLNYAQKRVLKIIEVKLLKQGQLLKRQKQVLDNLLGTVQQLNITTDYISEVTTDTNLMVGNIQATTQQILQVAQELNNKIINKPNIIHDINWNLNSFCQEHNIKYIDEITFNTSKFNTTNTLDYKHEQEKINCLKTLYSKSRQENYEIHVFGSNATDTHKVVEAIKLYGEVDERNIFQQANYHQNDGLVYVKQVAK